MKTYENLDEDYSITHYQITSYNIIVWFRYRKAYSYSYTGKAGKYHVDKMKQLAKEGKGLNAYIQENVWADYDE